MANIHAEKGTPNCPLCHNPMQLVRHKTELFFCCLRPACEISINVKDPNIERWGVYDAEMIKEILCPACEGDMNFFFRSDEYMKAMCTNPKCQTAIETESLPDRFTYLNKEGS